jgi:hypothetical protein
VWGVFEVVKKEVFNKTIRMPVDLIKKIEQLANEKDVSFNQVVTQCCEYALANLAGKPKN